MMRVIKLGGSLLTTADWVATLRRWLAAQSAAANLLIVGGGAAAETIRAADRQFGLPASAAHWLAIRAMQLNAELVAALLQEGIIVRRFAEAEQLRDEPGLWIADAWTMLRQEPRLADLPETWNVTSDSIAARLAAELEAEELVLLKSCLPPSPWTTQAAAAAGYVDAFFPQAAAEVRTIRCVQLSDPAMPEAVLGPHS